MRFDYPFLYFMGCAYGIKLSWIFFAFFFLSLALSRGYSNGNKNNRKKNDTHKESELSAESSQKVLRSCELKSPKSKEEINSWPSKHRASFRMVLLGSGGFLCSFIPDIFLDSTGIENWINSVLNLELPSSIFLLFLLVWTLSYQPKYGNRRQYLEIVEQLGEVLVYVFIACTMASHILLFRPFTPLISNIIWLSFFGSMAIFFAEERSHKKSNQRKNTTDVKTELTFSEGEYSRDNYPKFNPDAIRKYADLFPARKELADNLVEFLTSNDSGSCSICVSGKWGCGKTSFVNGALDKLLMQNPDYVEIRIDALELDTPQDLLSYVYGRIRTVLKERGIYVGIGSEFQEFIFSTAKDLTNQHIVSLIERTLFPSVSDYREKKEAMENLLRKTMKGRIIIVVDDIERCDQDKAKEFAFFAREVAELAQCTVIFVADYDYLMEKLTGSSSTDIVTEKNNQERLFFDKFFNHRIELPSEDPHSIMESLEEYHGYNLHLDYDLRPEGFLNPARLYSSVIHGAWFSEKLDLLKKLESKANTNSQKNRIQDAILQLSRERARFVEDFSNARNRVKMYLKWIEYCEVITKAFTVTDTDPDYVPERESVQSFLTNINLDKILFFLVYLYTCWPFEYKKLQDNVDDYFYMIQRIPAFCDPPANNIPHCLIAKLGDGLFFDINDNEEYIGSSQATEPHKSQKGFLANIFRSNFSDYDVIYVRNCRTNFIKALLSADPVYKLRNAVNPYSGNKDELRKALDGNHWSDEKKVRRNLREVVLLACEESRKQEITSNTERQSRLLKCARDYVVSGVNVHGDFLHWTGDDIFSCFLSDRVITDGVRLHFMKGVWDIWQEAEEVDNFRRQIYPDSFHDWNASISEETIQNTLRLYDRFLHAKLQYIYIPLSFYSSFNSKLGLDSLDEIQIANGDSKNAEGYLRAFINKLRDIREDLFPYLDGTILETYNNKGDNVNPEIEILRTLEAKLHNEWQQDSFRNLLVADYKEAVDVLMEMDAVITDIQYYILLCNKLQSVRESRAMPAIYEDDIDLAIHENIGWCHYSVVRLHIPARNNRY